MSSLYVASNNGSSTLAAEIASSSATSFTVASGQGDRFPTPTGGDYTLVTLENGSTREIVCVVGRSTDTMTIGIPGSASANASGRNYESILGMSATTFAIGSVVSCRATAAIITLGANSQATIPTTVHAATAKTTVVDADEVILIDSAASWVIKKFTLTTLWTWIQTHLASPGAIGGTTPAAFSGTTGTFSGAVAGASSIKSSSPTAGVGYTTGAGGTVTQLTSKATGVTLNTVCGQITTHNAALATGSAIVFVVTNSAVAVNDAVAHSVVGDVTSTSAYVLAFSCTAGAMAVNIRNVSGVSLSEAVTINFSIIKSVTS